MKYVLLMAVLLSSVFSYAQSVYKVEDGEALINLQGDEGFHEGDSVLLLNSKLDTAGEGHVVKISKGGRKALIKITAGKAQPGMTFEKKDLPQSQVSSGKSVGPRGRNSSDRVSYSSLSQQDREILDRGEISTTRYVIGGVVGTYPLGLGIGHAIQGRYSEKGWIFTVGEVGSATAFVAGLGNCASNWSSENCDNGLIWIGLAGYVGFRIWEIIDVWAAPPDLNRRYRELKSRVSGYDEMTFEPSFVPLAGGGALGVRITF